MVYTLRHTNTVPSGNLSINYTPPLLLYYTTGSETVTPTGITNLSYLGINLPSAIKNVNTANAITHKECYVFLGAWC